ncbi:hypothetical protein Taro_047554 [Colocasia esculenta]|uniref:Uncharacterized protein n=1 Tax=Colocasia esculenta TaxID=4460 RepID=A0A843WT92_COLES|nr:hypothetical protein [Colocasia esculenta]
MQLRWPMEALEGEQQKVTLAHAAGAGGPDREDAGACDGGGKQMELGLVGVDTTSSQVDTRDLSQGIVLPVWDSVSTHLKGSSTHSEISCGEFRRLLFWVWDAEGFGVLSWRRPDSPLSHFLSLRWFRSHVVVPGVRPQLGQATVLRELVCFCGGSVSPFAGVDVRCSWSSLAHLSVCAMRWLREPACCVAFTDARLLPVEPVEGVTALLATPLLLGCVLSLLRVWPHVPVHRCALCSGRRAKQELG